MCRVSICAYVRAQAMKSFFWNSAVHLAGFVNDDFVEKGRIVELRHGDMITFCKNPGEFRPRPVFVFQRSDAKNCLLPSFAKLLNGPVPALDKMKRDVCDRDG